MHQDQAHALAGKDDEKAAYHQGQVDLLVPLVKAYGSDQALPRLRDGDPDLRRRRLHAATTPSSSTAATRRSSRIYEGTNHIQAMDLVGRKLGQAGGANLQAFLGDVAKFVAANASARRRSAPR